MEQRWIGEYRQRLENAFGDPLLKIERGEGVYLWDSDGKRYTDLLAGIAVNSLGYAHPAHLKALASQSALIMHASNFFTTEPQLRLANTLQDLLTSEGYDGSQARVFFTNSGTESTEAALKLALLCKKGGTILAMNHGFHGRSLGALSITGKPSIREPFEPLLPHVKFVEPSVSGIESEFDESVAAIFIEPIQGEAGVNPVSPDVFSRARELCDTYDALLIVDEVQTGMGRTGRWFAHSDYVTADVMTLAKGLGGGFPIGATISLTSRARQFTPGIHGTTFGGNPLACSMALTTIDEVQQLLPHVGCIGEWLRRELEGIGYQTRGAGLLIGVEVHDSGACAKELRTRGFIVNNPNPHTLRLAPPLIIQQDQLEPFIAAMADVYEHQKVANDD